MGALCGASKIAFANGGFKILRLNPNSDDRLFQFEVCTKPGLKGRKEQVVEQRDLGERVLFWVE